MGKFSRLGNNLYTGKKSIVSQRDVGEDIGSFHDAVRGALEVPPPVPVCRPSSINFSAAKRDRRASS